MAAHDFASSKKTAKSKSNPPKKAARGKSTRTPKPEAAPKPKKRIPAILWIIIGISLAFGGQYFYKQAKNNPEVSAVIEKANDTLTKTTQKAIEPIKQIEEQEAPRFEFYELLKENKVEVNVDPLPVSEKKSFQYIVQAGSFRNKDDAERMRAQLILNNLTNTTTDSIKTQNGTWHRVMVGPFTNRSKLEKARDTLASLNIQGLVKKIPVKN
jgi:cell division protein FtsN